MLECKAPSNKSTWHFNSGQPCWCYPLDLNTQINSWSRREAGFNFSFTVIRGMKVFAATADRVWSVKHDLMLFNITTEEKLSQMDLRNFLYPWWEICGSDSICCPAVLICLFSHLNVNVATAKTFVRIEIDSVSQVDWFSLPLNESLILNHTTIVTNSMPNPFSSFHISPWWCLKSVGVHKWQRWPWFIWGERLGVN